MISTVNDNVAIETLLIELDTSRVGGYNAIDAVQIEGSEGVQWAQSAKARSELIKRKK